MKDTNLVESFPSESLNRLINDAKAKGLTIEELYNSLNPHNIEIEVVKVDGVNITFALLQFYFETSFET